VDDAADETRRHREERDKRASLEVLVNERDQDLEVLGSAIQIEQERFQGILKSASFGLLVLNGDDESIMLVNQQARAYLQLEGAVEAGACFDQDFRQLCPAAFRERLETLVATVKQTRQVCSLPPFTSGDGQILEMQSYPVLSHEALRATVIVINDITERTKLEEQLIQSSKLAGIGELAAGIAHEISSPIGFVASNTRTLRGYVSDLAGLVAAYHTLMDVARAGEACAEQVAQIEALEHKMDLGYMLDDMQSLVAENSDGLDRVERILREQVQDMRRAGLDLCHRFNRNS